MHAVRTLGNTAALEMHGIHACRKPARPPTADPFSRLLTLVTPLTTETGLYTPGPMHAGDASGLKSTTTSARCGTKHNACATQGECSEEFNTTSSCASVPITVSTLRYYLCKSGQHAAADEFLAAVCSAAEDSKLFETLLPHQNSDLNGTDSDASSASTLSGETRFTTHTATKVGWQVDHLVRQYEGENPGSFSGENGHEDGVEDTPAGGRIEGDGEGSGRRTSFCAGRWQCAGILPVLYFL